jgi:ferredoxin--NADP+ reductase
MSDWVQATVTERRDWNETLISLRFEVELQPFTAGQFIRVGLDIDGERIGRPYSLVNAPHEGIHEIYFNIVREGPLSPRLARLQPGDTLWVVPVANGFLTLDEVPEARHLWLLATGTALGPFLSILKTEAPWQRFERIVLGHSVRRHTDLTYQDLIGELLERHPEQLQYIPFITSEPSGEHLGQRIPACIESGALEDRAGLALQPEQSHVLLCGNAAMLQDTLAVLEQRGMRRHRRRDPGHVGMEKYH